MMVMMTGEMELRSRSRISRLDWDDPIRYHVRLATGVNGDVLSLRWELGLKLQRANPK